MAQGAHFPKSLLHKIAREQNFKNYDIEINPISSDGANYSSTLYNITISEGDRAIHMFAKLAAIGDKTSSQSPKYYETECFVYTKLSKIYEKLETDHNVPKEHRLVFSKLYGCHSEKYEETIALEDLIKSGYQAYNRFECMDWEYGKAATRELAKMHALSFAYGKYYEEEFQEVLATLKFQLDKDQLKGYLEDLTSKAVQSIREDSRDKLQRFFSEMQVEKFLNYYTWKFKPVLGHGDYRPSNLMHKIREDGSVDIKIVDLQTLQGGSPVVDLLYFIFTGSDSAFREQYYERLIDHYYTELEAAMKRLKLDPKEIYSKEDFHSELKEKLPFGLTIAVFALPVVTVDKENAPQVNENMELSAFSVAKTSALYTERLNGVVDDYIKWGVLT
ncbi:uncharacterized protein LOC142979873 isoform X3 [Anticarsia gemmatalis]|uniref:uncharacterized protein LOC142979873 isoform X3 n=1 Tax=Anticarsia gemmatalis TaxID=129554 RepID=UPI003F765EA4